jgi:hypothetical protein
MSRRTTDLAANVYKYAGARFLLQWGYVKQQYSPNGPFVCESDILILFDDMFPHQLDVWRKDKCKVLVGVALTKHGNTTIARKLRSIIDTQKLHAEIAGPNNYWVNFVLHDGSRFNSYLSSSVLLRMDDEKIHYELMDVYIVQAHLRSRQVKEWWRCAIRKQIKINQDGRMAYAHNEVLRRERAARHEQQRGRD